MTGEQPVKKRDRSQNEESQSDGNTVLFAANSVRLSARDSIIAAALVLLTVSLTPLVWKSIEPFEPQTDFRVPYDLSESYWTYERLMESAADPQSIVLIGDSVVWGEYVDPRHTLSHYFNELHGRDRFANGGVNGTHPLALHGLVEHYARSVRDARVILHCNLLWMSSAERDLNTDKEMAFNHPRLVPQFTPRIPCYKASWDERLGVVIDHRIPYRKWVNYLRVACFDSQDLHSWTLEHPYQNPFERIDLQSPEPRNEPHSEPISWIARGIAVQDIPWIDLRDSLQWRAFRATVETLRDRGNQVFVIVGPFNEHLLTPASRERYQAMQEHAAAWLSDNAIPYDVATLLPRDEYADASHPLSAGYAQLAKQVYETAEFQRWLGVERAVE